MKRLIPLALVAAGLVAATPAAARTPVLIGAAADPQQAAALKSAGVPLKARATFESWSLDRTPDNALAVNGPLGLRTMITWEPWAPTPSGSPNLAQPLFANRAIVAGRQDAYIRRFARALKAQRGVVYLRFAHEMNGSWYPWSLDAPGYVRAWRHTWGIFRSVGARNVRFVWSANLNTFQGDAQFKQRLRTYWPGRRYVDIVGSSLVRFRTQGEQGLDWSFNRMEVLHRLGRPVMLTEVKVDLEEAGTWLPGLRCALATRPWIMGLIWSETPSRLAERDPRVGNMNWSLTDVPSARTEIKRIAAGRSC